jgi:hypothetical protein
MGGRGASYQRTVATPIPPAQVTPPPAPDPLDGTPAPSGVTMADLAKMDDKELRDFLVGVDKVDIPAFLNSHHFQKMTYALGLNDKPEVVSNAQLQRLIANGATAVYRTVNDTRVSGVDFTATDICDMLIDGDLTYHGNGIHGDGLYFSDSLAGSRAYGNTTRKTMTGVLNSNARVVSESKLQSEYDSYVQTHPQTRRALGFAKSKSSHDSMSQFALIRGYNVITSGGGGGETYYTVLDRKALTMTRTLK